MKETILEYLKQIEKKYHVKILYTCEAGSRAWGLDNKESDYDVRFIYIHPINDYLSIDPLGIGKKTDVIELPISDTLDMFGWELTKALRLFRKSNPSLLEWLHTDLVYFEAYSAIKKMKEVENTIFSAKPCIHHYLNMFHSNFRKCLQSESFDIKLYLNVLRPILLAKWIKENNEFPKVTFPLLVDEMIADRNIKASIYSLINLKKNGSKTWNKAEIQILHPFVEKETALLENYAKKLEAKDTNSFNEPLNQLFRNTLNEVWRENNSMFTSL